eukprot:TRINITY_DN672_c0_g1_i3.p3 TRINITY_DN672_c0_g1~~TRINITY_DN672_c0_g1_i3.p3  ORF type:complete len:103 (+),score=15.66 TRINITY_DN672_c0_g1_i3:84-392(+)
MCIRDRYNTSQLLRKKRKGPSSIILEYCMLDFRRSAGREALILMSYRMCTLLNSLLHAFCGSRHFKALYLSLIHISEPTRLGMISYAVFCLKKKKTPPITVF